MLNDARVCSLFVCQDMSKSQKQQKYCSYKRLPGQHPCQLDYKWQASGVTDVINCRQHSDYMYIHGWSTVSVVTMLPAVNNCNYIVPLQSLYNHCAKYVTDGIRVLL